VSPNASSPTEVAPGLKTSRANPADALHTRSLGSVSLPKQLRSQQTLFRILDAAEELIAEKGLADASIPEIVRRAGSSVGGFYARFRGKNEMLRALEERFFDDLRQRVDKLTDPERWVAAPIDLILRGCVQELVDTFRAREGLIRAFTFRASQAPKFIEEDRQFREGVSKQLTALLSTRFDEFNHPDPELAIELAVQLAFGLMHQLAISGEFRVGQRRLTDEDLVDELTRNFHAYAGIKATPDHTQSAPSKRKHRNPQ
jgi:AcrR family transcriptional regulator